MASLTMPTGMPIPATGSTALGAVEITAEMVSWFGCASAATRMLVMRKTRDTPFVAGGRTGTS
jgi:hypothetical protein